MADVDTLHEESERVTLLTLHAAKGLEFAVVFIVGLEEDTLPHSRSVDEPDELEEERRLFYVGITRAERTLYLLRAYRRTLFGGTEPRRRSRFLDDLPKHLLEGDFRGGAPRRATTWSGPSIAESTLRAGARDRKPVERVETGFKPGDKVSHPTFGHGVVVSAKPSGEDEEVTVAFTGKGVKTLLQRLAKLQKSVG